MAIVSSDIVGYSRLMEADETGTLARMKSYRKKVWTPLIEKRGGRIVGTAGDSILVEFSSVVSAVECSIEVQEKMALREAAQPQEKKMLLRVGINIGEVLVDGEDIFGDGVNVAARLESMAPPGGICISGKAYDEIHGKLDAVFANLGAHEVKNISRPVHVWRWSPAGEPQTFAATSDELLPLPDKPSIAVLPFDNLSDDPGQEYFSDGISQDIVTALSKLHWLFVIGRGSTFTYKGSSVDVTRIARALGVRYVLEGSVRKAANKVRITAQLVDGMTGSQVWADRYDRELDDIFSLQDEITETIVGRIDSELRSSEMDRARRKPPTNLDAWDLYQRGLWHFYKTTKEGNEEARNLFVKSVDRDPTFALARAGIAFTCYREVFHGFGGKSVEWLAQGLAAGEQAVALDEKDGFTHFALGRMLTLTGQGNRAIAEMEKTVDLNPSFAYGFHGLGFTLNWYGRAADGIPKLDMAMRLSPHDPMLWGMQTIRADCCNNLEMHSEAEEWAHKAVYARVDHFWPHTFLAVALAGQNRLDEARVTIEAARRANSNLSLSEIRRLRPHYHPEYLERLIGTLTKVGLPK